MATVSITKAEVPAYLVDSDFFNSLSSDDDEEFSIPSIHLKMTAEIHNPEELSHLLHTLRFWGLSVWPHELFEYLSTRREGGVVARIEEVLREFDADIHLLQLFRELQQSKSAQMKLNAAVKCGRKDVIEYFLRSGRVSNGMVIKTAAENGLIDILKSTTDKLLTAKDGKNAFSQVSLSAVARAGHADCLRFLLTNGGKKVANICLSAAENGHLDCLKVAREFGCSCEGNVTYAAAGKGHLPCLEFALQEGCPIGINTALNAIYHKQIECLRLHVVSGVEMSTRLTCAAAGRGDLKCLRLLVEHNCPINSACAREAASRGRLACLKYLIDRGCSTHNTAADAAASGGYLKCLQLLYSSCGKRAGKKGLLAAVENGHVDVLKYLHSEGAVLTLDICAAAVRECHLPCLKFCVENKAPVDASLCTAAVTRSRYSGAVPEEVEILRYLHEVALCPWEGPCVCVAAVESKRLHLLAYAHSHGCPWDASTCTAAVSYITVFECLKYAHENGCPWDIITTNTAASKWEDSCIKYMLNHDCPCDEHTCALVAGRGNLACLRMLHERGCPWDETVSRAARHSPECLRYCVENGCPIHRETMDAYNQGNK